MKQRRHRTKRSMKVRINLENLQSFIFKEGNQYVALMPSLDLTTCGDSLEEAQRMACEAAMLFVEECLRMKTLDVVLGSLGWHKMETLGWVPPAFIAQQSLKLPSRDYAC